VSPLGSSREETIMLDLFPHRSTLPEVHTHEVLLLGTGANAPTVSLGRGIAVTRNSEGNYRITFDDPPGNFVGLQYGLQAETPADLKGHTVVADTFTAPTATALGYIDVVLYDSDFSADDLEDTEYISLALKFKRTDIT
jgi:hypothetical protein